MPCSDNDNAKTQASAASSGSSTSGSGFCVVNFYHLLEIPQPQAELELHRSFIADANLDLKCDPSHLAPHAAFLSTRLIVNYNAARP